MVRIHAGEPLNPSLPQARTNFSGGVLLKFVAPQRAAGKRGAEPVDRQAHAAGHCLDFLRYPKDQRSGLSGDTLGGVRHCIYVESPANPVPSQIFKGHIDGHRMFPGPPGLRGLKAPFGFARADRRHSGDAGNLQGIAKKRVIQRTIEPDDERIAGSSLGLG